MVAVRFGVRATPQRLVEILIGQRCADAMSTIQPGAEVHQAASLGTERPKGIHIGVERRLTFARRTQQHHDDLL